MSESLPAFTLPTQLPEGTMNFPHEVLLIVREATNRHHSNIQAAVVEAEVGIRALPNFDTIVADLLTSAVQELVYDSRHAMNTRIKRESGEYGPPAKVDRGSKSVERVYQSVFDYRIAGKVLGDITGGELLEIAHSQRDIAKGYTANALLCEQLVKIVPTGRKVRDVVSEKRLTNIFNKVHGTRVESKV